MGVFIMFVSDSIDFCKVVFPTFEGAAKHYWDAQTYYTTKQNGKLHRPIFFATMKHDRPTAAIFKTLDFRSVPNLL